MGERQALFELVLNAGRCSQKPPCSLPDAGNPLSRSKRCAVGRVLLAVGHESVDSPAVPWLSDAAECGRLEHVEFLLELRGNVNQQDAQRQYSTPLMLAVSGKALPHMKLSMCELLLGF